MSDSCIFCRIAQKEAPASTVYEDDSVIAFMSIQPIGVGHTLVIPKKHYETIYEILEDELAYLYKIVKKVAQAVKKAAEADGIKIVQNNGEVAGQVIPHLHVHIIPVSKDRPWGHHTESRDGETLNADAQKIQQFI